MKKSILLGIAISSLLVGGFVLVEAIKPSSDTSENTRLLSSNSITRVSDDGKLYGATNGDVIFYGSLLCQVAATTNEGIVIHFQQETLVKHDSDCTQNEDFDILLELRDQVDSTFQQGDLLAIDKKHESTNLHEVYREQTLP